jgi:hypothetical protein
MVATMGIPERIFDIDDAAYSTPLFVSSDDYRKKYHGTSTPIVIDNGAYY